MKKLIIIILSIFILLLIGFSYLIYPYIEPSLYPRPAGTDPRTGFPLEKIYFCMDICPDYGSVLTVYKDINTVEECEEIGGRVILTGMPNPGLFIGCGTGVNTK
ncbi:hypothetical protein KY343_03490 [Candidatus Woesearchaeota archaeon]|nr:hypothetical protein [Candidatus Woesearchaeota archaeon]